MKTCYSSPKYKYAFIIIVMRANALAMSYYDFAQYVCFESHHVCSSHNTNWLKLGCQQKSLLASAAYCKHKLRGF